MSGDWSSNLCDCFDDMNSCCLTYWCPCYQVGLNKATVDGRECHCCDCFMATGPTMPTAAYYNRTQIKAKYGLRQDPCADCCLTVWCLVCTICQHSRHLRAMAN